MVGEQYRKVIKSKIGTSSGFYPGTDSADGGECYKDLVGPRDKSRKIDIYAGPVSNIVRLLCFLKFKLICRERKEVSI